TNDDEIVVHHILTLDAPAIGDEFFLVGLGVHQHHVAVSVLCVLKGLSGADCDNTNLNARLLGEERQEVIKQPRVLRGGGGLKDDEVVIGARCVRYGTAERDGTKQERQKCSSG